MYVLLLLKDEDEDEDGESVIDIEILEVWTVVRTADVAV
jgi:hypothetical protein